MTHHTAGTVLAIDAGQTGMKVRIRRQAGNEDLVFPAASARTSRCSHSSRTSSRAAIARTGAAPDIVTAGVSGLTDRDADPGALLGLLAGTGVRGAVLAHDSTTSFLGALGDARGAVVASGTGVVTLAVGRESTARVDGWGYIMGDAGSGYWIGREALDAVMRAYDGRGPETALTDVVRERWDDLPQAYIALQASEDRVSVVASFASAVARFAETGDAVAAAITRRQPAGSSRTASRRRSRGSRCRATTGSRCARSGGVFRSRLLHEAFAAALPAAVGGASVELVAPLGEGIDGAMALADLAPGHPLSSAVHRATAS